ncbi:hypothetical protein [Persicitalea jodogahamensis]|uniref:Uncharacterized protein n=1 Tax=Persicitalea jodogahamensis TaxID=402147 RepID=A0A8J3D351_9BACT|nr:hypothetical protein [Persicitalea jodogahamensis]GHB63052.1 hypothetical protein GCM10007390_16110 [Persicitalea jodogahamensis]
MNKLKSIQIIAMLGLLILAGIFISARTIDAGTASSGPVLLDGRTLHTSQIWLNSNGKLSLIVGSSENKAATRVPFRVVLKRGNMIISRAVSETDEMEISRLLKLAALGDELEVEPLDKNLSNARRVFRVGQYPSFHWIPALRIHGDGC